MDDIKIAECNINNSSVFENSIVLFSTGIFGRNKISDDRKPKKTQPNQTFTSILKQNPRKNESKEKNFEQKDETPTKNKTPPESRTVSVKK